MVQKAHVVVLGNAKGGSGKSTTAMHIITRLLALEFKVCAIDLDGRQQTLTRYLENRQKFVAKREVALPMPASVVVEPSVHEQGQEARADEEHRFQTALEEHKEFDFIVIDCPGTDNFLSRLGHRAAHTLITPLNDSFIDMDLLARVDAETFKVEKPSWYSEMVWEQRKSRFLHKEKRLDWIVIRNRLLHTETRNKRHMYEVLDKLGPSIGFRHIDGLNDRVIFRELFLHGLTLSDLRKRRLGIDITMSHITAHQELRDLVGALKLPGVG